MTLCPTCHGTGLDWAKAASEQALCPTCGGNPAARADRSDYSLLLYRADYTAFREWAQARGYGESATAFRALWQMRDAAKRVLEADMRGDRDIAALNALEDAAGFTQQGQRRLAFDEDDR